MVSTHPIFVKRGMGRTIAWRFEVLISLWWADGGPRKARSAHRKVA